MKEELTLKEKKKLLCSIAEVEEKMDKAKNKNELSDILYKELDKNNLTKDFINFLMARLSEEKIKGVWLGIRWGLVFGALFVMLLTLIF